MRTTNCSNASCETHCSPRTRTKKNEACGAKGGKVRREMRGVQHASARGERSMVGGRGNQTADQQNVEGGFKFRGGGTVIGGPITPRSEVLSPLR
ncbi:hypothetical protein CDAR_313771 [Caerostris darwini]|uniref:Uncharacterized protein n=1 Tax=Caerostris darwini TaxID=1538125 RepID=A0AAV4N2B5_9ARAC|nr:hypothetical protein CDAR_313771 [Caerostris darwini]